MTRHAVPLHCLARCLCIMLLLAGMALPVKAAEFNFRREVAKVPSTYKALSGTVLTSAELTDLLHDYPKEIGRIINDAREGFADNGTTYRINYRFSDNHKPEGTIDYSDPRNGHRGGHFLIQEVTRNGHSFGLLCRSPEMNIVTEYCRTVHALRDNLYEARGYPSGQVRYRFRLFDAENNAAGSAMIEHSMPEHGMEAPAEHEQPEHTH